MNEEERKKKERLLRELSELGYGAPVKDDGVAKKGSKPVVDTGGEDEEESLEDRVARNRVAAGFNPDGSKPGFWSNVKKRFSRDKTEEVAEETPSQEAAREVNVRDTEDNIVEQGDNVVGGITDAVRQPITMVGDQEPVVGMKLPKHAWERPWWTTLGEGAASTTAGVLGSSYDTIVRSAVLADAALLRTYARMYPEGDRDYFLERAQEVEEKLAQMDEKTRLTGSPTTFGQKAKKTQQEFAPEPSPEYEKATLREKFTKHLPETLFLMAPELVGSYAPYFVLGKAGAVHTATSTADDVYMYGIDAGLSRNQAQAVALGTGIVVGAIDMLPIDNILGKGGKQKLAKGFADKVIKRIIVPAAMEGTTEGLQEGVQLGVESVLRDDLSTDEATTRLVMSTFMGTAGGGFMAGTSSVLGRVVSGESISGQSVAITKEGLLQQSEKTNLSGTDVGVELSQIADTLEDGQTVNTRMNPDRTITVDTLDDGVTVTTKNTVPVSEELETEESVTPEEENVVGSDVVVGETPRTSPVEDVTVTAETTSESVAPATTVDTETPAPTTKPKTDSMETLRQEAKKYKSAEEFVKTQGVPVYRSGESAIQKNTDVNITNDKYKKGMFFTTNREGSKAFGKETTEAFVNLKKPFVVDAKGSYYTSIKTPKEMKSFVTESMDTVDTDLIADYAHRNGYDGVIIKNVEEGFGGSGNGQYGGLGDDYIVFDNKSFQTKSQLTDIWNEMNESTTAQSTESDVAVTETMDGQSVETQFIRPPTARERRSDPQRQRSMAAMSVPEGWGSVVYKPWGEQGAGFYYQRVPLVESDGTTVTEESVASEEKETSPTPPPVAAKKTLPKKKTLKPVQVAKTIVGRTQTLGVLGSVLVRGKKMFTTDLTTAIEMSVDMPDGVYRPVAGLLLKENTYTADDFPDVKFDVKTELGSIDGAELGEVITNLAPFLSKDDARPTLTGVHVVLGENTITMDATDGYQLYSKTVPFNTKYRGEDLSIIFSAAKLSKITSLLQGEVSMGLAQDGDVVFTSADGNKVLVRAIHQQYPDIDRLFEGKVSVKVDVSVARLRAALKEIIPYKKQADDAGTQVDNSVRLLWKDGEFSLQVGYLKPENAHTITIPAKVSKVDNEVSREEVAVAMPLRTDDGGLPIVYNHTYLTNMANAFATGEGSISLLFNNVDGEKVLQGEKRGLYVNRTDTQTIVTKPRRKVSGGGGLAMQGAVTVSSYEARNNAMQKGAAVKIYEKSRELVEKYGRRMSQGMVPRGAEGVFYPDTQNIFVNGYNNLAAVTHELAHFLDKEFGTIDAMMTKVLGNNGKMVYNPADRALRKGLTQIYTRFYPGGKKTHRLSLRLMEGYATLIQKYSETPTLINQEYPEVVAQFLTVGGKYYQPIVGEMLADLDAFVAEFQKMDALDKFGARVARGNAATSNTSMLNIWEKINTQAFNYLYPVHKLNKLAGVAGTSRDILPWVEMYDSRTPIIVNNIAGDGKGFVTYKNGEFKEVLDYNIHKLINTLHAKGQQEQFDSWLVARRAYFDMKRIDEWKGYVADAIQASESFGKNAKASGELVTHAGGNAKTWGEVVVRLEKELERMALEWQKNGFERKETTEAYEQGLPLFAQEAEMHDKMYDELLTMLADPDVQLITPRQLARYKKREGYASRRRFLDNMFDSIEDKPSHIKSGKVSISALKKSVGGAQEILSPTYSLALNQAEMIRKAMKQMVYNKLYALYQINPDALGEYLQVVKLERSYNPDTGITTYPQERDDRFIMARAGGKRVPIAVGSEVKQAIDTALTPDVVNNMFAVMALSQSRFFTRSTTGIYAAFALTNFPVDVISGAINTRNRTKPLLDPLKVLVKKIRESDSPEAKFYLEYLMFGGERQTMTGWLNMTQEEQFRKIRDEKTNLEKIVAAVDKGADVMGFLGKHSEIFTRAGEYVNARMAGKTQAQALSDAGDVTVKFRNIGRWGGSSGRTWVRSVAFMNPGLQVSATLARTLSTPEGRKRFGLVAAIIAAGYLTQLLAMVEFATDEQRELYKDLDAGEMSRFLFLPSPDGKNLLRLRVPEQVAAPGALLNMILSDHLLNTDYSPGDYWRLGESIIPEQFRVSNGIGLFFTWMPQLLGVTSELAFNKTTYPRIKDIVPQSLQRKEPRDQYYENTSGLSKEIGDLLNISPIKIDYAIKGYLGRAISLLTGGVSGGWTGAFTRAVMQEHYVTSGRRVQNYYEVKKENDAKYQSTQSSDPKLKRRYSSTERSEIRKTKEKTDKISDLLKTVSELEPDTGEYGYQTRKLYKALDDLE